MSENSTSPRALLSERVGATVARLASGIASEGPRAAAARGDLAKLRRGLTSEPGSVADIWELTIGAIPEAMHGRRDEPSAAETAAHVAVCLFALHQQSNSQSMYLPGQGLGKAVRLLSLAEGRSAEAVERRFHALTTSSSISELTSHLRSIVTLLRGEGIALDYGRLAVDLYRFANPQHSNSVRLAWGRDYVRNAAPSTDSASSTTQTSKEH